MKLKLMIGLVLSFTLAPLGMAEDGTYPLNANKEIRIDVAGQDMINLVLEASRLMDQTSKQPEVTVIDQFGSFECEIAGQVRKSMTPSETQSNRMNETYVITIDWFPGADYSGCHVEVKDPYSDLVYKALIYMSY